MDYLNEDVLKKQLIEDDFGSGVNGNDLPGMSTPYERNIKR